MKDTHHSTMCENAMEGLASTWAVCGHRCGSVPCQRCNTCVEAYKRHHILTVQIQKHLVCMNYVIVSSWGQGDPTRILPLSVSWVSSEWDPKHCVVYTCEGQCTRIGGGMSIWSTRQHPIDFVFGLLGLT